MKWHMDTKTDTKTETGIGFPPRPWWKFGFIVLVFISVIGFLIEGITWDKQTVGRIVCYANPNYWSLWSVPVLWGVVAWMVTDTLNSFAWIRQHQYPLKAGIVIVSLCSIFNFYIWFIRLFRQLYNMLYVTYIMGPLSQYMMNGTLSWKLAIIPTVVILVILLIVIVIVAKQKMKKDKVEL
jgi:hypothetical protein